MSRNAAIGLGVLSFAIFGCYQPVFADCKVACDSPEDCPHPLTCNGGMCSSGVSCQEAVHVDASESAPAADADAGADQVPEASVDGPSGCFDVSSSFTSTTNPSLPWTYGGQDNGSFVTYANFISYGPVCAWYAGDNLFQYGMAGKNTSDQEVLWSGSVSIPAGMILLHPGLSPTSGFAVVATARWTAPSAGRYLIQGSFVGLSNVTLAPVTTSDVHVVAAGRSVVYGEINLDGFSNEVPFSVEVTVAPGDFVDFGVGLGSDGSLNYDSTGLTAVICPLN